MRNKSEFFLIKIKDKKSKKSNECVSLIFVTQFNEEKFGFISHETSFSVFLY